MRKTGEFTLVPVIWAVQFLNLVNMCSSFVSHIPSRIFGQRLNLIAGTHGVYLCLLGIVVFNELGISMGILVCLLCHLCLYQVSMGAIVLTHVQETCSDPAVGFATLVFFMGVVLTSSATPVMIEQLGTSGCFGYYGVWTVISAIYLHLYQRDTTYKTVYEEVDDGFGEKRRANKLVPVSEKEKKELYMADEFKE